LLKVSGMIEATLRFIGRLVERCVFISISYKKYKPIRILRLHGKHFTPLSSISTDILQKTPTDNINNTYTQSNLSYIDQYRTKRTNASSLQINSRVRTNILQPAVHWTRQTMNLLQDVWSIGYWREINC